MFYAKQITWLTVKAAIEKRSPLGGRTHIYGSYIDHLPLNETTLLEHKISSMDKKIFILKSLYLGLL